MELREIWSGKCAILNWFFSASKIWGGWLLRVEVLSLCDSRFSPKTQLTSYGAIRPLAKRDVILALAMLKIIENYNPETTSRVVFESFKRQIQERLGSLDCEQHPGQSEITISGAGIRIHNLSLKSCCEPFRAMVKARLFPLKFLGDDKCGCYTRNWLK